MDKRLLRTWQPLLWRLAAGLAVAAGVGAWFGLLWQALALALAGVLAYTLFKVHRLHAWLLSRRRMPPEEGRGLWFELNALLGRHGQDRRRRQHRLLTLVKTFRQAADALPDAAIYLSSTQRIVWFNRAATSLIGLRRPRDIGVVLTHLLRSPRVVDWLAAGAGEPLFDVPAPDDEKRRLGFRLIRYGEDGEQLLIVRDITQLLRLEQVRRDFVANVSHELRTPLTVLHGYLDLLDPDDAPQLAPMLDEMRAQSSRMARLVEDLLTLSRLESGTPLQDERVRMSGMLDTLVREARALSQGAHRIDTHIDSDADLLGSTKELHSAFSNLVSNAVRYTPEGGAITIAWYRIGAGVTLEVGDTGQGIPQQHLPRITERFYRISSSRSRESGGTGLGLSIVKHVLQLHQAQLEIESDLGKGSRFRCVFGAERILAPTTGEPVAMQPSSSAISTP